MSAQENEIDEAIALFGPSNGSVLSREQALDILSALGICLRGSDVDAMLPTELTAEELKAMLPQLRTKNMQREELVQLMRSVNPNTSGSLSMGIVKYVLRSSNTLTENDIQEFLDALNLEEQNGMVQCSRLIDALISVLN